MKMGLTHLLVESDPDLYTFRHQGRNNGTGCSRAPSPYPRTAPAIAMGSPSSSRRPALLRTDQAAPSTRFFPPRLAASAVSRRDPSPRRTASPPPPSPPAPPPPPPHPAPPHPRLVPAPTRRALAPPSPRGPGPSPPRPMSASPRTPPPAPDPAGHLRRSSPSRNGTKRKRSRRSFRKCS